jgi:lipopolysaccharide transport system ATP-binding protein
VSSLLEVGTGFHPELTGRENVYMNGTILGMRKNEINSKFDEIVEFSGVERFLDTPVKRYSSGMKVRLAFSVAAHLEPEVLIVDEVLAVGDAAFQNKCLGKMSEVTRGGRTVLFVSHNMAAVQALCTRGIVLNGGQSIYDGDAGEAIAKYTLATQETISAVDLNSRTDRVGGEQLRFDTIEFMDTETMDSLQTAISGQAVTVKLSFTNHSGEVLKNVGFSIGFYTASGQYLCGSRSDTVNSTYSVRPGKGVVFCRFPKWPLNGGRYVFNILAERQGERLDWVKEAGFIAVQAGDYYGSGKMPATEIPSVLIEYSWEAGL